MAAPIYNPPIPYVGMIPNGMSVGKMIRIQGSVPMGAQRFAINLQCGPNTNPRDDMALHLNFRFVEQCIVRNHLVNMQWGAEQTSGGMPLAPGQAFEALLLCDPNGIKLALNGSHFCEYPHHVQYQRISHITLDGEVYIQLIAFEGGQMQPSVAPSAYSMGPPSYAQPPMGGYAPPAYQPAPMMMQQAPMMAQGPPMMAQGMQPQYVQQRGPMMARGAPMMMPQGPYYPQQRTGGMSTGAAVGMGLGGMALGGLAGYGIAGGFGGGGGTPSHVTNENITINQVEAPSVDNTSLYDDGGDFGGDDWMD